MLMFPVVKTAINTSVRFVAYKVRQSVLSADVYLWDEKMGLFGNPRKNKNAWAAIVMENAQPWAKTDEKMLDLATELYIKQRIRILYESIRLVFSSEDEKTRRNRYELAREHDCALLKVQKFASKEQKKVIHRAVDDFLLMEDWYQHPNRGKYEVLRAKRQREKDEFWEAYGMMEMIDIFFWRG